jgi:type I restriction enzyme S subunit
MKKESSSKQTGIGFIPNDWVEKKVGDFVDIKHGYGFKGEFFIDEPNEHVVLTPGNFNIGGGFKADKFKYTKEDYPCQYVLRKDDIIVTMTDLSKNGDTLGYAAKVPASEKRHYLHNQRIGLLEFRSGTILPEFLYWVLRTKKYNSFVVGSASGSTVKHTSPDRIKEFAFCAPSSLLEQQTIAKTLSDLDSKIEANQKMNRTLEAIGRAVFKRWFVDFEFPNEEGKPYKSSGGEMVCNKTVNKEIPVGWKAKKIGELVKINEHSINKEFEYSEIEYVDIDSVEQGIIKKRQMLRLADAPSRARRIVKNGDIIISTVRPNLKHFAFVQGAKPNTVVSTGFAVISPIKACLKFILYHHLTTDKYTEFLTAIADAHTSTYPSFNPDIIQNSLIPFPSETERRATAKILSQFDSIIGGLYCEIQNNNEQISTLSQLRDTLLPKLMSGKIRVPVPKESVEVS